MNLNAIANAATQAVNPNSSATLRLNSGVQVDDTGKRISTFEDFPVTVQAQSLSTQELTMFDALLQQGQMLSVYVNGQFHALRRISQKGADKLIFTAYGETSESEWLVKSVQESYPDWCRVLVWRQS